MATPLLLTYNLDFTTTEKLSALCADMGISIREIRPFEYDLPIGALAGLPFTGPGQFSVLPALPGEMLVICHMLSDQLDALLGGMRAEGIPQIPLKAVLTPSNVAWNSWQLRDELAREHEKMQEKA